MCLPSFQDDSSDWEEMRPWLVWCMRSSLEEEHMLSPENNSRLPPVRKKITTSTSNKVRKRLRHQGAFDHGHGVFDHRKEMPVSSQSSVDT